MSLYRYRSICVLALFAALLGIIVGCGDGRPRRVPISGQVFIDGKPLTKGGQVRMIPEHGRAATGTIEPDGRFTMMTYEKGDGCVPGTYGVEVICCDASNPAVYASFIPEKYGDTKDVGTYGDDRGTDRLFEDRTQQ